MGKLQLPVKHNSDREDILILNVWNSFYKKKRKKKSPTENDVVEHF